MRYTLDTLTRLNFGIGLNNTIANSGKWLDFTIQLVVFTKNLKNQNRKSFLPQNDGGNKNALLMLK